MSAKAYLASIVPLVEQLGAEGPASSIRRAGKVVADSLGGGGKIWMAKTSHCLHTEATYRAGGLIAVHILDDAVLVQPGDCVIEGTPVGTSGLAVETALEAKARGATLIALTNVAFETDHRTILEHPSGRRLHEIADIVVDVAGPIGDGIFTTHTPGLRVIPHSGVTEMVAMWMIFAEAMDILHSGNKSPRFYECIMVTGASERNDEQLHDYLATSQGYMTIDSADS